MKAVNKQLKGELSDDEHDNGEGGTFFDTIRGVMENVEVNLTPEGAAAM